MNKIIRLNHLTEDEIYIREKVFVEEQGFKEEFDSIDSNSIHFICYIDDVAAGVCRVIYSNKHDSYMIGRVAILKEYRNKGIGKLLMLEAENYLKDKEVKTVMVSAQKRAIEFYEKCGYKTVGDFYLDEHYPHILMVKELI